MSSSVDRRSDAVCVGPLSPQQVVDERADDCGLLGLDCSQAAAVLDRHPAQPVARERPGRVDGEPLSAGGGLEPTLVGELGHEGRQARVHPVGAVEEDAAVGRDDVVDDLLPLSTVRRWSSAETPEP